MKFHCFFVIFTYFKCWLHVWEITGWSVYTCSYNIFMSKLDLQPPKGLRKLTQNVKCHFLSYFTYFKCWLRYLRNDRLICLHISSTTLYRKLDLQLLKFLRKLTKMWNVIFLSFAPTLHEWLRSEKWQADLSTHVPLSLLRLDLSC